LSAFKNHSKPMLAMLMSSRGPLPVEMVREVVVGGGDSSDGGDDGWSTERQHHLDFVQRMCVGSLAEVGLLQFSHKSFPDWLEQNEKFHVGKKEGEALLSSVCLKVVAGGGGDGGGGGSSSNSSAPSVIRSYAFKHVVSHLLESDRKEKAKKLLLNVGFLLARGNDGAGLIRDCQRMKGDRTVEILSSAIGLS
jgi:hypothetical protein